MRNRAVAVGSYSVGILVTLRLMRDAELHEQIESMFVERAIAIGLIALAAALVYWKRRS